MRANKPKISNALPFLIHLIVVELMDASEAKESLWSFALAFYARPAVAETCLLLQDQHSANVCMLIGLHWLDARGCILSAEDLKDLSAHTFKWNSEIIEPLRSLRRALKQPFEKYAVDELQEQLRNSIKQAELLAEKKLLMEIESWSIKIAASGNSPQHPNLTRYLKNLGLDKNFIDSITQKLTSH